MHMILKSDLKMAQASTRCIPHLLLEDDCGHNQASYNCKLSDVLSNSNDVAPVGQTYSWKNECTNFIITYFSLKICMVIQK